MAKRRRRRRRRNQLVPILVAMLLIILVAVAGIVTGFIKKYTPSDVRMELADYYHTGEGEAALILQDTISEAKGKIVDGRAYLPYSVIANELGGRFYWDKESEKMLYTTATDTLEIKPEDTAYTIAGQTKQQDYILVKEIGEEFYIALDFVEQYMPIQGEVYDKPDRIVVSYKWGDINTVSVSKDTEVRYQGGIKSPILSDVKKGDTLILLEEMENWSRVMTTDGIDGYVEKKNLEKPQTTELSYTGEYKGNWNLTTEYQDIGNTRSFSDDYFSASSGNSKITVKEGGVYFITASITVKASNYDNMWMKILKNGAEAHSMITVANGYTTIQCCVLLTMSIGDWISAQIAKSSEDIQAICEGGGYLQIVKLT